MMATELHAGQQAGAALAGSKPRPEPMIWVRAAAPEIPIVFLLRLIPAAEAKLYGVLTELIPSPSMVMPNLACRQIKMAKLAKLANLSRRWVIKLLVRLEERDLIRTDGGRGAAKWIWLLPLGVPRLGKASSTGLTQKETRPEPIQGKAKAPQTAAQPKRRRQEKAQSAKPVANVQVAPPAEKPAEIPKRRQKAPLPSTPPTDLSPKGPVQATRVTLAPPTSSGSAVPAAAVKPPPSTAPARAVRAAKVTPPPAPAAPVAQTAVVVPPTPPAPAARAVETTVVPPTAPGNPAAPARVTPPPATAPASRAAQAAMVTPPPPAAAVMPPPPTPDAQAVQAPPPAAPAKPASRRSIKKIPAVRRPKKKAATIEELVAYIYPQPWPPNLILDLKPPVMTAEELPLALHLLCRQPRRFNNRTDFVSALRSALHDYLAQTSWYL
jgi:hypothetical protein